MNTPEAPDPEPRELRQPPLGAPLEIQFQNPNRYAGLDVRSLRPWLESLLRSVAPEAAGVGIRFVSDVEMQRLNREFRNIDRPTDVLSFPGDLEADGYLGDVAVSVPTARRQANARPQRLGREVRTLLLHGILHCLGYDHETDSGEMERLEADLRARWLDGREG